MFEFNQIYQLAKQKQTRQLKDYLSSTRKSVDIQNNDFLTPAGLLAFEGNTESARYLITNFVANIDYVAEAAAYGGQLQFAEKLMNDYGTGLDMIARGCARATAQAKQNNNNEQHNRLYDYLIKLCHFHGASLDSIIEGAALAGDKELAKGFAQRNQQHLKPLIKGAATYGDLGWVQELLQEGADPQIALEAAASATHEHIINDLINDYGIYSYLYNTLTLFASSWPYNSKADKNTGLKVEGAIFQLAKRGSKKYALTLYENYKSGDTMTQCQLCYGAAAGGHNDHISSYLDKFNNLFFTHKGQRFMLRSLLTNMAETAFHNGHLLSGLFLYRDYQYPLHVFTELFDSKGYAKNAERVYSLVSLLRDSDERQRFIDSLQNRPNVAKEIKNQPHKVKQYIQRIDNNNDRLSGPYQLFANTEPAGSEHTTLSPLDQRDKNGETPLTLAVQNKNYQQAQSLLQNGADPDVVENRNGRTPLMLATLNDDRAMVELLIPYSPAAYIQDHEGQNIFHMLSAHDVGEKTKQSVYSIINQSTSNNQYHNATQTPHNHEEHAQESDQIQITRLTQ